MNNGHSLFFLMLMVLIPVQEKMPGPNDYFASVSPLVDRTWILSGDYCFIHPLASFRSWIFSEYPLSLRAGGGKCLGVLQSPITSKIQKTTQCPQQNTIGPTRLRRRRTQPLCSCARGDWLSLLWLVQLSWIFCWRHWWLQHQAIIYLVFGTSEVDLQSSEVVQANSIWCRDLLWSYRSTLGR